MNSGLIVIGGPTASGKSKLAVEVAKKLNTCILSADARQIYREIPIGSAAPDAQQLEEVKHFFVGSHSLANPISAADFAAEANAILPELLQEHKYVVVVGGSGMYIDALLHGFDEMPNGMPNLRAEYMHQWYNGERDILLEALKNQDPIYFHIVDKANPQRIIRALEVIAQTGKPYSSFRKGICKPTMFPFMFFATALPRDLLYQRINLRCEAMLEAGWLEEAKELIKKGWQNQTKTLGYEALFDYLQHKINWSETILAIQQSTRRYAKRQITWLKKKKVVYVSMEDENKAITQVLSSLSLD